MGLYSADLGNLHNEVGTMQSHFAETRRSFPHYSIVILFFLAGGLYLLQIFTPLRLTTDSLYYLTVADSAALGNKFHPGAQPIGYPVFLFLLMKAGIFSSATMILANCVFFATGLFLTFRTLIFLGFERRHNIVACLFALLSFAAVKHITQGMSDFLFFALSAAVCWVLTLSSPWRWVAASVLICSAMEVRIMGLALICPIAVLAWPHVKRFRTLLITAIISLSFGSAVGLWVGRHYLSKCAELFGAYGAKQFFSVLALSHLQDFGEIISNAPLSKMPFWIHPLVLVLGGFAIFLLFVGMPKIWRRSPWLCSYLIGCCLLVLPWPYTDPRFWLPVLPIVFLTIASGVQSCAEWMKLHLATSTPLLLYGILFCTLGLASLGYSTRITFSGQQFPYRYGDGLLTNTYLTGCGAPAEGTNSFALHLLREYQWHCR